jgi:nitrite reductase (NADH) small subunit
VSQFEAVTKADDLEEGEMRAFDVQATKIAIANLAGTFHALGDTCTYLGCSLAGGELEETIVTCPYHGSQFDVVSGAVLQGPARVAVGSYEVRAGGDSLEVKAWCPRCSRSLAPAWRGEGLPTPSARRASTGV